MPFAKKKLLEELLNDLEKKAQTATWELNGNKAKIKELAKTQKDLKSRRRQAFQLVYELKQALGSKKDEGA